MIDLNINLLDSYKDDSLILFLSSNFNDSVPKRIDSIGSYVKNREWGKVKKELHALKNTFGNIGASDVAELCQFMEDSVDDNKESVCENISELKSKYLDTKVAFSNYIEKRMGAKY